MEFFIIFALTLFFSLITLMIARLLARSTFVLAWLPAAVMSLIAIGLIITGLQADEAALNLYHLFAMALLITSALNAIYIVRVLGDWHSNK